MNNYHTYDELGRGKYSIVYKVTFIQCRKQKTLEYLAIKSVELSRRKKLMNEVRILNELDHINILKFYTWYETSNHLWIVFSFCPGGDLKAMLKQDKQLPESTIRHFGYDLISALLYLHANGIIYADLKPSNLLFTEDGILKLSDFGLSKRIVDLVTSPSEENHAKRGTPYYMAPELFQEDGVYSFYSDLWSLGCVLYEMITGSPPFRAQAFKDLIHEILTYDPPQISDISAELEDLIQNLLQKDPAKRIAWEELLIHPFWGDYSRSLDEVLPSQPHYEAYLVKRGVEQRTPRLVKTTDSVSCSSSELRLSQIIQKSLIRESFKNYQEEINHDKELDFDSSNSEDEDQYNEEMDFDNEDIQARKRASTAFSNNLSPDLNPPIKALSLTQTPTSTKPVFKLEPLDSLIFHTTDSAVKPIIGNRDIEKAEELNFDSKEIHIKVWSTEDLLDKIDTPELKSHLSELYSHLASNTTILEKVNLLVYFERILIDSQIANKLINSAFVELFVRILRNTKSHEIKRRICNILGCMIRHATLIETDLANSGVCNTLWELTKDKNETVRRKAMGGLGEYLFYAATQMDEESYDHEWVISNITVVLLTKILKLGDDEILRFYATKTIENITAQTRNAGMLLCIPEILQSMVFIFLNTKLEGVKISSFAAISHIVRLNPSITSVLLDKLSWKNIHSVLRDSHVRIQQAVLSTLFYILKNSSAKLLNIIQEDDELLSSLISLIESPGIVVRGKTVLCFMSLIKFNSKYILKASELKFLYILDKLLKDPYKYVQNCMSYLLETLAEISMSLLSSISELLNGEILSVSYLESFKILSYITSSTSGSLKLPYNIFLKQLSSIIQSVLIPSHSDEIKSEFLIIIENLISYTKALANHSELVITEMLPSLISIHSITDPDIKLRCLKVLSDIIIPYMYDSEIYDPNNLIKPSTKMMNDFLNQMLLPQYSSILQDKTPISLFGMKLLSAILERSNAFVAILDRENLISKILENFEGTQKLNLHLLKVVKKIIESKETTLHDLENAKLSERLVLVLKYSLEKDWCVDIVLDMLHDYLGSISDSYRSTGDEILRMTFKILGSLEYCAELLGSDEEVRSIQSLSDKSTHCIILILKLYNKFIISDSSSYLCALGEILQHKKVTLHAICLKVLYDMQQIDQDITPIKKVLEALSQKEGSIASYACEILSNMS